MKTIFVSGASGFFGKVLIKKLLANNFRVLGLSRSDSGLRHKNYKWVKADICDYGQLHSALRHFNNIKLVIHLAAKIYSGTNQDFQQEMILTNIVGSYNIVRLVNEKKIKSFIYVSSMSVYKLQGIVTELTVPQPDSIYGWTKLFPESFMKNINYPCDKYIMRFSGLYGPGRNRGVIYKLVKTYLHDGRFRFDSDGLDKWNPLYIGDAIKSIIFVVTHSPKIPSGIYNVGLDSQVSIREINQLLCKITNKKLVTFSNKKSNLDFFMKVDKIKKLGLKFEKIEVSLSKFYESLRGEMR